MAVEQKRRTFINPARPVKRPSVKVEDYLGKAKAIRSIGKVAKGFLAEDDDKKAPAHTNTVKAAIRSSFDKLDPGHRLRRGAFSQYNQDFSYEDLATYHGGTTYITEDEFETARKYLTKYGKVPSGQELRSGLVNERAREGGKINPNIKPQDVELHIESFNRDKPHITIDPVTGKEQKKYFKLWDQLTNEEKEKAKYTFYEASFINEITNRRARLGVSGFATADHRGLMKLINEYRKADKLTASQANKLFDRISNTAAQSMGMANQEENARQKRNMEQSRKDEYGGSTQSRNKDAARALVMTEKNNRAAIEGQISYLQMEDAYNNFPGLVVGKPDEVIRKRNDDTKLKIQHDILPQAKVMRIASDKQKQAQVIQPTMHSEFGQTYAAQAYMNMINHETKGEQFKRNSGNPLARQMMSAQAQGLELNTLTSDFNGRADLLTKMGISGKEYANALTTSPEARQAFIEQMKDRSKNSPATAPFHNDLKQMIEELNPGYKAKLKREAKEAKESKEGIINRFMSIFGGGESEKGNEGVGSE